MSDRKEQSVERRDFRHSKDAPEINNLKSRKNQKKPWVFESSSKFLGRTWTFKTRYKTEKQALQALTAAKKDSWREDYSNRVYFEE